MRSKYRYGLYVIFAVIGILAAIFFLQDREVAAQAEPGTPVIVGRLIDSQDQPIAGAHVALHNDNDQILSTAVTQKDGRFVLEIGSIDVNSILSVERPHFQTFDVDLRPDQIEDLLRGGSVILPNMIMERVVDVAFWISAVIFIIVLFLIVSGYTHNTLATLVGASLLLGVSYIGYPINDHLYIFDFAGSISYIDWNVIFLIMGMMMFIAIVENTGIFQWMAFFAYKTSRGKMLVLLPILMLITGVASAFLDNVTTMLLMTPITVQIALSVGINPLSLLIPEVMASNVIGVSTLVGTPTNIMIGSYAGISFNGFLQNLTPGVLLAFTGLVVYSFFLYRKDLAKAHEASETLIKKLEEGGRITEPENLKKAGWIGAIMLVMFIFGERIHLLPSVTAIIGATALLLWIRPNIEEMIEAVDWTTLVFFMSLFIVVGAVQEVGLISIVAEWIGNLVGDNLVLAMVAVTWLSAILSMIIANIPFTAAMLPVVGFLTAKIPGAENGALFFCLSVGSAMGGNGSLIGASANMVTAGISEAAGYKISYNYFLKKGFPAVLITVGMAFVWLLVRFL